MACLELPNGTRFELVKQSASIGRDVTNDVVVLNDSKVSRLHAELQFRDGRWLLLDLGSRNGTIVNGRRVRQHPLKGGDRIECGENTFVFIAIDDPNVTETSEAVRGGVFRLSRREREVVDLVAEGLTDREIGERLFISASTVRSHLDRVSEKTGFRRRVDLIRLAAELGARQD
jgi:pSer/pThr/pTyr-binding forkhead associated (FHA) protein